jgi:hypothetical protein
MKKTMNTIDVAALANVVGGALSQNAQMLAWTIADGVVSTIGAVAGGWALWREYKKDEKEKAVHK